MGDKKTYTPVPQVPQEMRARYEAVMGVLSGRLTVSEAARSLGLSRNHFQTLMHRSLAGMIEGLTPKAAGRPAMPEREQHLMRENEQLRKDNARLSERTETTDRLLIVASGLLRGRVKASGRTPRPKAKKTDKEPSEDPDGVVLGARQMRAIGLTATLAAAVVGASRSTLRRWDARLRAGLALRRKPGPEHRSKPDALAAARVEQLTRQTHGLIGAQAIAHAVAGVSRRAAAAIKARTCTAMERERRIGLASVTITEPGVVRGFDQLWAQTTCGLRPVLVSADACIPYRTSLVAAERYDSRSVARAVDDDFREHGAPLVWRADRARCHRTDEVEELLRAWGVLRLHGPPHLARFYGQLERQNREHRAWLAAGDPPTPDALVDVCEDMRRALNETWPRRTLGWMTPAQKWTSRAVPANDRTELRLAVAERRDRIRRHQPAADDLLVDRLAIETTLTQRGYLQQQMGGWC